jgi:hypothetical protein
MFVRLGPGEPPPPVADRGYRLHPVMEGGSQIRRVISSADPNTFPAVWSVTVAGPAFERQPWMLHPQAAITSATASRCSPAGPVEGGKAVWAADLSIPRRFGPSQGSLHPRS